MAEANIEVGQKLHRVFFHSNGEVMRPSLEVFLAVALLPAMKLRVPIIAEGDVSRRFLTGVANIQDLFLGWKPGYRRVDIHGVWPVERFEKAERVGLFFSGGMDSYYSLLCHQEEITDLIFIHGFDQSLNDLIGRRKITDMLDVVGRHFSKNIIEIESNVRDFLDQYIFWGLSHGASLAAIGHLLSQGFQKFYIASSFTADRLHPWGTDPRIDPEWGTESVEFIHDGLEADRLDKTAIISENEIAMITLRVCLQHPDGVFNCGHCEKCRRAMIYLRAYGALDRCTVFEKPFELRDLNRLDLSTKHLRYSIERTLEIVELRREDSEFEQALRKVLNKPVGMVKIKAFAQSLRALMKRVFKKIGYRK